TGAGGPSALNTPPAFASSAPDASAAPAGSKPPEEMIPAGNINFQGVDVNQVLDVYAKLVGRTMLRAGLPTAQIVLRTETPLTKSEAIQALQAVLALNNISLVNVGDKFVKVLPVDQANSAGAKMDQRDASALPEMGSYVTHIVQLKYTKPSEMIPIIQPFAKLANSILAIDSNGILVLRDNAENVKRMLEMIDQVDVSVPAEYISEVIPIRYAMAEDIASALNSLGGSGGSTVSFGGSSATPTVNGIRNPGGAGGAVGGGAGGQYGANNQPNQPRQFGQQGVGGGAPTGGTTFQQRLQSIIQKAASPGGQQDQIQVFGQAKIIADQRSNALLVFATQADMEKIKAVVSKLDVLLAQVLIEAIIMDVNIGNSLSYGVSAAQRAKTWQQNPSVTTAGAMNNNQPFYNFIQAAASNNSFASGLASTTPNNLSYFGNIGNTWDLAVQAAAADNNATVIQRPRIQTSQAKPASFFVGNTVPYITGTYNGGYNGGNSSQYSQLSVGVELDVTPFINPDGLVVMDINQEIDDVSGYTSIDGNNVPNTDKRTLSSEIAVRDRDTIILGGFIRSDKSNTRTGVPLLQDIPILGALFSSSSKSKNREELIVLMRPTVLKTPALASVETLREEQRLPGVSAAAAEDAAYERQLIEAERKREIRDAKVKKQNDGFYNAPMPLMPVETNTMIDPNTSWRTTPRQGN
ncbi:MAG: secretin N-terminal domain-containing protein, partial [Verrucomicrobiia bacterium]